MISTRRDHSLSLFVFFLPRRTILVQLNEHTVAQFHRRVLTCRENSETQHFREAGKEF